MALLPKGVWIVVADGEKAMFLENIGTTVAPKLRLHEKMEQELEATREMGTDRPGRMPDPGREQLSAMEQTDFHRQAKERFAAEIAQKINKLMGKGSDKRLVIAAPPQSLAVLREKLSPIAVKALIAQLPKNLTQHPMDRIATLLAEDIDKL